MAIRRKWLSLFSYFIRDSILWRDIKKAWNGNVRTCFNSNGWRVPAVPKEWETSEICWAKELSRSHWVSFLLCFSNKNGYSGSCAYTRAVHKQTSFILPYIGRACPSLPSWYNKSRTQVCRKWNKPHCIRWLRSWKWWNISQIDVRIYWQDCFCCLCLGFEESTMCRIIIRWGRVLCCVRRAKEIAWIRQLLNEIRIGSQSTTSMFSDN